MPQANPRPSPRNPGRGRREDSLPPGSRGGSRGAVLGVCGLLVLAVAAVFAQTLGHGFINFDDPAYVSDNPKVARGLTLDGVKWAIVTDHAGNWHPLTWLSHMADCQLYRLEDPGGHHLTSVLLHAATAVLLFLAFRAMTGDLAPSALVAALFAVHPLHVESVAWVAERKDVLSGLFFVLTLWAYAGYARRDFSLLRYLLVLALFALGLMAKPMLVTLPFVLLLLDYWPLRRFAPGRGPSSFPANVGRVSQPVQENPTGWKTRPTKNPACGGKGGGNGDYPHPPEASPLRLVLEKLPLLALSVASSVVTCLVQRTARHALEHLTLGARIANALVSYATYLGQFFYPSKLAVFYPHPQDALPAATVAGAGVVLALISAGALAARRRYPYLLVGWLWYLGMLVPVIGLVQVGEQARADRYSYLPQIGLYAALAWGLAGVCKQHASRRWAAAAAAGLIAILAAVACRQASYWRDSETLWTHALECASPNAEAHFNLGNALAAKGDPGAAIFHYRKALKIKPDAADVLNNLGNVLAARQEFSDAIALCQRSVDLRGDNATYLVNLGNALAGPGRLEEAEAAYRKALDIDPGLAEAHNGLGAVLFGKERLDEAAACFRTVLAIEPAHAKAHYNLGVILGDRGQLDEAAAHFQKALAAEPGYAKARLQLDAVRALQSRASGKARSAPR